MINIGFTLFKEEAEALPTTQELLDGLTSVQKTGILNSFAKKISILQVKHQFHIPSKVINYFYNKINKIQEYSAKLMRGQVEAGIVDEEMTYEPSPTVQSVFVTNVVEKFAEDFSTAQTTAILTKMVVYSDIEETGTWSHYKTEIVK